jgi:hypothetical protein
MLKVWHVTDTFMDRTSSGFGHGAMPQFPQDYDHVANVLTKTVEEAYRLTNHIDNPWWDNERVVKTVKDSRRSTSVGDVVETETEAFRCEMVGWTKIA